MLLFVQFFASRASSRCKHDMGTSEGAECVWEENAMQFLHNHQLATSLSPRSQLLGLSWLNEETFERVPTPLIDGLVKCSTHGCSL